MAKQYLNVAPAERSGRHKGELELVRQAQAGDHAAFTELVDRYKRVISSVTLALSGSLAHSEDLAQETFVNAWMRLPKLREPDRFRSWIYAIARNLCRNRRRDFRSTPDLPSKTTPGRILALSETPSKEPSPLDQMITREEEKVVLDALGRIPEAYRVPLVLFYQTDQSMETVAALMGLTENNLRQRLYRGRRMLQEEVVAVVESALRRSRPRAGFTTAVMAAILIANIGRAGATPSAGAGMGLVGGGAMALVLPIAAYFALTAAGGPSATSAALPGAGSLSIRNQTAVVGLPRFTYVVDPAGEGGWPGAGVSLSESTTKVLSLDFEDGLQPSVMSSGALAPCPAGSKSKFCNVGRLDSDKGNTFWKTGTTGTVLFEYKHSLMLHFDYWVGAKEAEVSVQISCMYRHQMWGATIRNVPDSTWGHATFALDDMVDGEGSKGPPDEGNAMTAIYLYGSSTSGTPSRFFVDNIELVDVR